MGFEYQLKYYANTEISLMLFFDNPALIAKAREPDMFLIRLKDTTIFRSRAGEPIEENVEARFPMRPQIGHSAVGTALKYVAFFTASVIGTNFTISIILKFSANQSMSMMISLLKQLQIIVHLLLMDVIMPANTAFLFSYLIDVLTFDPIDIGD
jgi:hypothetical protein